MPDFIKLIIVLTIVYFSWRAKDGNRQQKQKPPRLFQEKLEDVKENEFNDYLDGVKLQVERFASYFEDDTAESEMHSNSNVQKRNDGAQQSKYKERKRERQQEHRHHSLEHQADQQNTEQIHRSLELEPQTIAQQRMMNEPEISMEDSIKQQQEVLVARETNFNLDQEPNTRTVFGQDKFYEELMRSETTDNATVAKQSHHSSFNMKINPKELQRAVVLKEILDKPKALQ